MVQQGAPLTIHHAGAVVTTHAFAHDTGVRRVDPAHLAGNSTRRAEHPSPDASRPMATASLLRPLSEYATIVGDFVGEAA